MQIEEMRAYIRSVVEIDSSDISDDVLNRFLGEAYDQMVYSEKRWPWYETSVTFSTVALQKDYTITVVGAAETNGLREIQSLRTDNNILTFLGRDDADIVYPLDSASSGDPYYWSFWGESIRIYPTPGGIKTIYVRGYKNPTAFGAGTVDGTSPTDFPEPFHVLIATYGISRAYEQQEDLDMSISYMNLFARELDNLRARYLDSPAPQPLIINNRSASRWRSQSYMPDRLRYSWE
tara:strand:- start:2813 stop:3517 length:705 start_codon:yes stop_codon:yes gene_type:complete